MNVIKKIRNIMMTVAICAAVMITNGTAIQPIGVDAATTYSVISPVKNPRYTSYFGKRNLNGGANKHNGLDIVPKSSKNADYTIYAAESGTVLEIHNNCSHISYGKACSHTNEYGNSIIIKTKDGRIEIYGHIKKDSLLVAPGEYVNAGQAIATMGSSGYSTGTHLHFEVRKGTRKLNANPSNYKNNPGVFKYNNSGHHVKKSDMLIDGSTYLIVSAANAKTCLTVKSNSRSNQAAIVLGSLNAKSSEWVAHQYDSYNNIYFFKNKYTGKVLDCAGTEARHGGNIQQYKLSGPNETQLFHITKLSNGKYTISPAYRAVHVNVYGNAAKNGSKIWLYSSDKKINKNVNNKTECFSFVKK